MKIMWLFISFIFIMGCLLFLTLMGIINHFLGILLLILGAYIFGAIYKDIKR